MTSHYLLSQEQYRYITSQTDITNPSEQRKRISNTIDNAFKTFDVILTSNTSHEFVDELFDNMKLKNFFESLIKYNPDGLISAESNKQKIARHMISLGFLYFQSRYSKTNYLKKQIEDINSLLSELDFLADTELYESEAMEMYRARKNVIKPPQIVPEKDFWSAECIFCFSYSSGGKSEKDAIGRIRHSKHCLYPKDVKKFHGKHKDMEVWRYIRSIPPRDK